MNKYIATCPKSLEGLLEQELKDLGAVTTKQTTAGVFFTGELEVAYRVCLWSRLASRLLMLLAVVPAETAEELYRGVYALPWTDHIPKGGTLIVDFVGVSPSIRNSHFGALKVKDAIVDHLRDKAGWRPDISKDQPSLRINVFLDHGEAHINLDLSGDSLHRRGYRLQQAEAPLKENLAAALLLRAGWPAIAKAQGACIDPMCGSSTLLIEAAMMASDTAPGLLRSYFGFTEWLEHVPALWRRLRDEALARREVGMKNLPEIRGYDASPRAISISRENIARAGFADEISVTVKELAQFVQPTHTKLLPGLIITNPPYGDRLSEVEHLKPLYQHLGARFREEFLGWQAAVFVGNVDLGRTMGIRSHHYYNFFNGAISCRLLLFKIAPEWFVHGRDPAVPLEAAETTTEKTENLSKPEIVLSKGADMFANRLRKNIQGLKSWVAKNNIECYRVYDADMPEYAVAVDRYKDYLHVQEYAPPKTIDPEKAEARLDEIMTALPVVFDLAPDHIVLKQRKQQRGKDQYQRFAQQGQFLEVMEGGCRFLVNLTDYIDTGLFLDHRPLRLRIQSMARGKRFLNLFCYTAAVTVHAAKGGARSTLSVDMSSTYLEWARKNLGLNGFSENLHRLTRANCLEWLDYNTEKFDLILLDPPTFSNSKSMDGVLDIQRDHVELIRKTAQHLALDGILFFSTNFQKFKLDPGLLDLFNVKEISRETIDPDFHRQPKIHRVWEIVLRCHTGL